MPQQCFVSQEQIKDYDRDELWQQGLPSPRDWPGKKLTEPSKAVEFPVLSLF